MNLSNIFLIGVLLIALYFFAKANIIFVLIAGAVLFFMESKQGFMILVGLLVLYIALMYMFDNDKNITEVTSALNPISITSSDIKNDFIRALSNYNYSTSIWFYIDDWGVRYSEKKNIILLNDGTNNIVTIYFSPDENNLNVDVMLQNNTIHTSSIENVPLQRWCNFVLCMRGRAIDLFLNGKLIKTNIMSSPHITPISSNTNINITPGGGFGGFTSRFAYYPYALNSQDIWNIYKNGYTRNITGFGTDYNIRMGVYDNNSVKAEIQF